MLDRGLLYPAVAGGLLRCGVKEAETVGKGARRAGFTLMEILIVIVIISILLALLLPAIGKSKDAAKRAVASSDINNMNVGLTQYEIEQGDFPPSGNANLVTYLKKQTKDGPGLYMEFKSDYLVGSTYRDPWNNSYVYIRLTAADPNGKRFYLYSWGPNAKDDTDDNADGTLSDPERTGDKKDDVYSW